MSFRFSGPGWHSSIKFIPVRPVPGAEEGLVSNEEPQQEEITFVPLGKAAEALRNTETLTGLPQAEVLNRACLVYEMVAGHVAAGDDLWFVLPAGPGWFGRHVPRRKSFRVPNAALAAGTEKLTFARARPGSRG
jgi:hypothetical protein